MTTRIERQKLREFITRMLALYAAQVPERLQLGDVEVQGAECLVILTPSEPAPHPNGCRNGAEKPCLRNVPMCDPCMEREEPAPEPEEFPAEMVECLANCLKHSVTADDAVGVLRALRDAGHLRNEPREATDEDIRELAELWHEQGLEECLEHGLYPGVRAVLAEARRRGLLDSSVSLGEVVATNQHIIEDRDAALERVADLERGLALAKRQRDEAVGSGGTGAVRLFLRTALAALEAEEGI